MRSSGSFTAEIPCARTPRRRDHFCRAWSNRRRRSRIVGVENLETRLVPATITVNTTADDTAADSTLSLREAIEVSNGSLLVSSLSTQEQAQVNGAVGSTNTIDFNIPTTDSGYSSSTGVWTIKPQTELPAISNNAAIINGYSQTGASENTLSEGDNAKPTIALSGVNGNGAGLTLAQSGSQLFGLDIENFVESGVVISAGGSVQVAGCFIGTDPTGENKAANGTAITIENSSNLIGGPNAGDRNILSGSGNSQTSTFVHNGVYVPDQALNPLHITPTNNVIENNIIGLDAKGTKSIDNEFAGVYDLGSGDTYGGASGLGNVISGNFDAGIDVGGNVTIEGNFIGTDVTGTLAIGNNQSGGYGIFSQETTGLTSISETISNNLISGNSTGIDLYQTASSQSSYTISNNLIGTNAAGAAVIGSGQTGIALNSVENATISGNVVSGNSIGIQTTTTTPVTTLQNDVIQGNLIGTDKTGTVALGNSLHGIEIGTGSGITIGGTGPGQGNVIANSGYFGIYMVAGGQDIFSRNSIYNNAKGGIDVTPGSNGFVPPPQLTFAPGTGGTGILSGSFFLTKNTPYVVEIFSNPTNVGFEGQTFVEPVSGTSDGSGNASFSVTLPIGFYTATTTILSRGTSDFSDVAQVSQLAGSTTTVGSSANPSTLGQQVTFTAVVTAPGFAGTPTGAVTFTIDGVTEAPIPLAMIGGSDEAQITTNVLSVGPHTITAAYSGDTNVSPSSGSLPNQTVNPSGLPSTTTTATSAENPSTVGQLVTFTAVVSTGSSMTAPTGAVTFTIDGHVQSPVPIALVGGAYEAEIATAALGAGQHSVWASYGGDSNYSPSSTASALVQTVNPIATTIALASSALPSTVGQSVSFTATVHAGLGAGTPTGVVTFTIDGTYKVTEALKVSSAADQAVFQISTLTAGKHSVTVTYAGDSADAPASLAAPLIQTVVAAATPADPSNPPTTVTKVQRFGIHTQPTVLVVSFNTKLNPTSAADPNNYAIVSPLGAHIRLRSAVYSPNAETVTLRPRGRIDLHWNYRFTIKGSAGVLGADLVPLDGNGRIGTDYVTTLNWKNVVLSPSQTLKFGKELRQLAQGAGS